MKLLIQPMSVHSFSGISKDLHNVYFKSSSLHFCHRSYLKTSNEFTLSFYGTHLQEECNLATGRLQGDSFSSHHFLNDPE